LPTARLLNLGDVRHDNQRAGELALVAGLGLLNNLHDADTQTRAQ
jgi:hypothetical protein